METDVKVNHVTLLLVILLMVQFYSCGQKPKVIDPKNMDLSVKPSEDFYQYANGNWIKSHPIPDEYSRYGAFESLAEENYKKLRGILESAAADQNAEQGSIEQKIGDFYRSGMDTVKIEELGISPILPEFEKIDALTTTDDLIKQIAYMHTHNIFPAFEMGSGQDLENSEMVILHMAQGGLGLPDRDYYVSNDPRSTEIRDEYVKHITKMFTLAGESEEKAQSMARDIMDLETRLAIASMTRLERRNPQKINNPMDLAGLKKSSDNMNWELYFTSIGLSDPGKMNIQQPLFFKALGTMVADTPIDEWKTYLKWNILNRNADYLSSEFVNQDFNFYGKVLSGTQALRPRWKRMLSTTNGAMGEAVGQIYVAQFFPPEAKARMIELVKNLKYALGERIKNVDWMSDETKTKALAKLAKMNYKIGYPDKWIDYSSMDIVDGDFMKNIMNSRQFNFQYDLDKVGKPVDRTEWGMSPQTVNAYYQPLLNEIVFPAAILQPPFFYQQADDAVNYGAIGYVIGHEMTHGFDDQGRQFDADGNLNDWWTPGDEEQFKKRAEVLVDQFDNSTVLDTLHVDGKLTLGENIADLGGLNVAYTAYLKSLEGKPEPAPIDGMTDKQRFFFGAAQLWRQNIRDKETMRRIKEDVHSPGNLRINVPFSNMPEFYAAFDVKPGDAMYREPDDRAKIW